MVRVENNASNGSKTGFPLNENGLMFSVFKWANDTGVPVEINVDLTENIFNPGEYQIQTDYNLLESLPKARLLKLDGNGKPVLDDLDKKVEVIEENPDNIPDRVRGWLKLKNNEKGDEEFVLYPRSKAFPIVNAVFEDAGEIDAGNKKALYFDWDELEPLMNGFAFNMKVKQQKGGSKAYFVPYVDEVL